MRSTKVDGHKIKVARELAGHTQQSLAEKLGVDRSAIARWESNRRAEQPLGANFRALCSELGVAPAELLESDGDASEVAA